jgi:hypothetical protein
MFVYIIVNDIDGKIYIGKTKTSDLQKYLQSKFWDAAHQRVGKSYLFNAIRKHGPEHFHIYPLISTLTTNEDLCFYERVLIADYDAQNPDVGYNICRGGEGFTGSHSAVTRACIAAKMSIIMLGNKHSAGRKLAPEHIEKMQYARLQQWLAEGTSPATIQKLQDSHTGLCRSEASCEKQSQSITGDKNHFYGKTHSDTTRTTLKRKRAEARYFFTCLLHGQVSVNSGRGKCPICKQIGLEQKKQKRQRRQVRCVDTNEIFSCLTVAVKQLGGNPSGVANLSRAIEKHYRFMGKRFEYVKLPGE